MEYISCFFLIATCQVFLVSIVAVSQPDYMTQLLAGDLPDGYPESQEYIDNIKLFQNSECPAKGWIENLAQRLKEDGVGSVLAVNSGSGLIAEFLKGQGVEVISCDQMAKKNKIYWSCKFGASYIDNIKPMSAKKAIHKYGKKSDALMIVDPPVRYRADSKIGKKTVRALQQYKKKNPEGRLIIFGMFPKAIECNNATATQQVWNDYYDKEYKADCQYTKIIKLSDHAREWIPNDKLNNFLMGNYMQHEEIAYIEDIMLRKEIQRYNKCIGQQHEDYTIIGQPFNEMRNRQLRVYYSKNVTGTMRKNAKSRVESRGSSKGLLSK